MANGYLITVPIDIDTKQARHKLKEQFTSFKEEIQGEILNIRINADAKDLEKIKETLKSLSAEDVSRVSLSVDRAGFDKQLSLLNDSAGRTATQMAKAFQKNIQASFDSLSFDKLIEEKTGKRYSQGRAKEVIGELQQITQMKVTDETDFITITKIAEAYEQLSSALDDFSKKKPTDFKKLGFSKEEVATQMKDFYKQIGDMMSKDDVKIKFSEQITNSFQTLKDNLKAMMDSIVEDARMFSKQFEGAIGGGTGTGGGESGVSEMSEEVQRIITQIDELSTKMTEARSKLDELNQKKIKMPNFQKTFVNENGEKVKIPIDDLIKEQEQEIDRLDTKIKDLQKKKEDLINGVVGIGTSGEGSGSGTGDGSGNGASGTGSDNGGFSQANEELDRLNNQIDELTQKIEQAKEKLQTLKNNTRDANRLDIGGMLTKAYDSINWDATEDEILKAQQHIVDLYTTYQKVGGSFSEIRGDIFEDIETWMSSEEDGGFNLKGNILDIKVVDENAIQNQTNLINQLERNLNELKIKRDQLIEQSNRQHGESGAVSGEVTVKAKPDGSNFIQELQEQIGDVPIDVSVQPKDIDGFKQALENGIGEIGINIKLNKNSQKNDILENITQWNAKNRQDIYAEKSEQAMIGNPLTGYAVDISNNTVAGISNKLVLEAIQNATQSVTSVFHSHPNDTKAAFSYDDIIAAINHKINGIINEYVVSLNDISMLDISQFTEDQLRQISQRLQDAMTKIDTGKDVAYVWDEYKVFDEVIKNNISTYINIILDNLQDGLSNSNMQNGEISSIISNVKAKINNSMSTLLTDYDGFNDTLTEILSSENIDITQADNYVQYAINHAFQVFAENILKSAIKQVAPNVDMSKAYKSMSIDDFYKSIGLKLNGESAENEFNIKINPVVTDIREKIETELQAPFDIKIGLLDSSKNHRETHQSTTVSTTRPLPSGGSRTVTNTNDNSTSTGGTTVNLDDQARLQSEYSKTRTAAQDAAKAIDEVNQKSTELQNNGIEVKINPITDELRPKIETVLQDPFEIKVNPAETLKDTIQQLLDENAYKVNIDVDNIKSTNTKIVAQNGNSPSQIIADMMDGDTILAKMFGRDHLRERAMFLNSKTGQHTNPFLFDQQSSFRTGRLFDTLDFNADTGFHSHPRSRAMMSINNFDKDTQKYIGDLITFLSEYKHGIQKQIIAAQKDVQIFDVDSFIKDHGDKFGAFDGDGTFAANYTKVQSFLKEYSNYYRKYFASIFDDYRNLYKVIDFSGDNHDFSFDAFSDQISKIDIPKPLKNSILSLTNNGQFSQKLWGYISEKQAKQPDVVMSVRQVFEEFVQSVLEQAGQKINLKIDDGAKQQFIDNFTQNADEFYPALWRDIVTSKDDNAPLRSRYSANKAFEAMGIPNFIEKYNTFMPIEDFRSFYENASSSTGFVPKIDATDVGKQIQEGIDSQEYKIKPVTDTSEISQQIQTAIDSQQYHYKVSLSPDSDIPGEIRAKIDEGDPYLINIEVNPNSSIAEIIKAKINEGNPYLIDVDINPDSPLITSIQNALNNANFTVDAKVNTDDNGGPSDTAHSLPIDNGEPDQSARSYNDIIKERIEFLKQLDYYRGVYGQDIPIVSDNKSGIHYGTYFDTSKFVAASYVKPGESGGIYRTKLDFKNPYYFDQSASNNGRSYVPEDVENFEQIQELFGIIEQLSSIKAKNEEQKQQLKEAWDKLDLYAKQLDQPLFTMATPRGLPEILERQFPGRYDGLYYDKIHHPGDNKRYANQPGESTIAVAMNEQAIVTRDQFQSIESFSQEAANAYVEQVKNTTVESSRIFVETIREDLLSMIDDDEMMINVGKLSSQMTSFIGQGIFEKDSPIARFVEELSMQVAEGKIGNILQYSDEIFNKLVTALPEAYKAINGDKLPDQTFEDSELVDKIVDLGNNNIANLGKGIDEESRALISLFDDMTAAGEKLKAAGWDGQLSSLSEMAKNKDVEVQKAANDFDRNRNALINAIENSDKYGFVAPQQMQQTGDAGQQATGQIAAGMNQAGQETQKTTAAVIELKNALQSIGKIYSSSGREGLITALSSLTPADLKEIVEKNGYTTKKGTSVKTNNSKQLASIIADNYEKSIQSPISLGATTLPEQEEAVGQAGQQMGEQVADGANTANEAVQRLSESLAEIFTRMQNSPNEIFALFGENGWSGTTTSNLLSEIKAEDMYRLMLSNLPKNIFGSLHNHPSTQEVLSAEDFNGVLQDSGNFENGMKLAGVLSGDKVRFFNFNGTEKDQLTEWLKNYKVRISQARDEIAKQFGYDSFKIMPSEARHKSEIEKALNEKELAVEKELVNSGVQSGLFKKNPISEFNVSDAQAIAKYLLEVQQNSQAALSPLQQLINLIEYGAEKKLDLGSEEVKAILDAFSSGSMSGLQAFDRLINTLGGAPFKLSDQVPNQTPTSTVKPTQTFDNEIQQNLVSLENYKNTIAEIDKLKLEPETDETRAKIEELNTLADYFASKITVIRGEGGSIDTTFMRDSITGGFTNKLRSSYTDKQLEEMEQIGKEKYGTPYRTDVPQFTKIGSELADIESKSDSLSSSLRSEMQDSSNYVKQLKQDLISIIDTREELAHEPPTSKWIEQFQNDIERMSARSPEILPLLDSLRTMDQAMDFTGSDKWFDFLATLPKAHEYLESIGYDFKKIQSEGGSQTKSALFDPLEILKNEGYQSLVERLEELDLEQTKQLAKEYGYGKKIRGYTKMTDKTKIADSIYKQAYEKATRGDVFLAPLDQNEEEQGIGQKTFSSQVSLEQIKAAAAAYRELHREANAATGEANTSGSEQRTNALEHEEEQARETADAETQLRNGETNGSSSGQSSDTTPQTPSADTVASASAQASAAAESAASTEASALNLLIQKLQAVAEAIDAKTDKFRIEAQVVDGVVSGEVNMLDALLGEVNLIVNDLAKLAQAITSLPEIQLRMNEVGEGSTINESVLAELEKIKTVFEKFQINSLDSISNVMDKFNITGDQITNLITLTQALDALIKKIQELSSLNYDGNVVPFIDNLLTKSEELKNLAEILNHTKEQFEEAKTILEANKRTYDEQSAKGGEKAINDQAKLVQEQYEQDDGVITAIQRMYDSHGNLVEAVVTAQKQMRDADGKLKIVQQSSTGIKFGGMKKDENGNEIPDIYTYRRDTDSYSAAQKEYERQINAQVKAYQQLSAKQIQKTEMFTAADSEALRIATQMMDELNEKKQKGIQLTEGETNALKAYEAAQQAVAKVREQQDKKQQEADKKADQKVAQDRYKQLVDVIKQYEQAVSRVNDMEARRASGKSIDPDREKELLEQQANAARDAAAAFKELYEMRKNLRISSQDFLDANKTYTDAAKGSQESQNRLANARATAAAKAEEAKQKQIEEENAAAYQKEINIIKEAIKVRNEYNQEIANQMLGKSTLTDTELDALVERLNQTKQAAEEAYKAIQIMGGTTTQGNARISYGQVKDAEKLLQQVGTGDQKPIQDAQKQLDTKEINDAIKKINEYYEAGQKLQQLQERFASGEGIATTLAKQSQKMIQLKKDAESARVVLENFVTAPQGSGHDYGQRLTETYEKLVQKINETATIMGTNVIQGGIEKQFETAEKGYKILTDNAERYAKVLEKQRNKQALTFGEAIFKNQFDGYFKQALNEKGVFQQTADAHVQELRNIFLNAMDTADQNVLTQAFSNIEPIITKLENQTWNQAGVEALEKIKQEYDKITVSIGNVTNASKDSRESMREDLDKIIASISNFSKNSNLYTNAPQDKVNTLNRRISEWIAGNTKATEFIPQMKELQEVLNGDNISAAKYDEVAASFERIRAAVADARKMGLSFGDALKKSFSGLGRYLMTYASFYRVIGVIKQGISIVKEFDAAMTEVRKVTGDSISKLHEWQAGTFDAADIVGGSALQIQKSTASWIRLGKSFSDAQEAAQASVKLLNVSEFTNIDDATTSLLSITQAYKELTYDDVIDKLNMVGDHFSSSTDQLAKGLQNAAAVLKTQGNDIDQALALLAAGNDVTQDISKTSAGEKMCPTL